MEELVLDKITVILLTANKVPAKWAKYHLEVLKEAAKGHKWMTLSKDPVDFGRNDHTTSSEGLENIYKKVWLGAILAETEYIATVEDDTLYHKSHFDYRPKKSPVAYDMNRWAMFTWDVNWSGPFYFHKPRMTNAGMIAKREYVIEAMENRYKKWKEPLPRKAIYEIGHVEGETKPETYHGRYPFLCLSHRFAIDELEQKEHKKAWPVQAYDIPHWGRAEDMRERFE